MTKRKLQLVLVANYANGDEGIHLVEKLELPSFRGTKDLDADEKFEAFVKEKIRFIQKAIDAYEYEQSLPAAGMESGCW